MKNRIIQCSALLALLMVSYNPDQFGSVISRIAALTLGLLIVLLIPNSTRPRHGRYLASVTVSEYGQNRALWSQNYHFRCIAQLMARRAALRYDFLGDAYSGFDLAWHVDDLSHLNQRIHPTPIFRKVLP